MGQVGAEALNVGFETESEGLSLFNLLISNLKVLC